MPVSPHLFQWLRSVKHYLASRKHSLKAELKTSRPKRCVFSERELRSQGPGGRQEANSKFRPTPGDREKPKNIAGFSIDTQNDAA